MILSIYFGFHDSCITLADKEKILIHLEGERYFRKKHISTNAKEMDELVNVALKHIGVTINDIKELLLSSWFSKYDLKEVKILGRKFKPIITSHHKNHIGTVLPFGMEDFFAVVADGGSEDGTTKFYNYSNQQLELLADYDDSIITGKFFGTLTQLVIDPNHKLAHQSYPGKLMGLAPLGQWSDELAKLISENEDELNKLHNNCSHLRKVFNISETYDFYWTDKRRCDLAFTGQRLWISKFIELIDVHRNSNEEIRLSGGCALNLELISSLEKTKWFKKVLVSPVSNDSGQSLGAILWRYPKISCNYPFIGRSFGDVKDLDFDQLIRDILDLKIIAWFEGSSEIGPRALGHRSFLGLPKNESMRIRLSVEIKKREKFRPVSPMIPIEMVSDWFNANGLSPYMTTSWKAKEKTKKLAPAVVHVDGTSRVQTIRKEDSPILHKLLTKLHNYGYPPILMNTSFNCAGEPNVDTPEDAKKTFKITGADILYLNGRRTLNKI
jgi:carbamoyltransferase